MRGPPDHYVRVSQANKKSDTGVQAWVRWDSSSIKNIRMWFQVVNNVDDDRGKMLFQSPDGKGRFFNTTAKYDSNYWLRAGREHIGNPGSYITGVWEP